MIATKIKLYLDEVGVPYEVLHHDTTYTAMETAAEQHIPGKQVVKSVLIKINRQFALCILKAIQFIDFEQLQKFTKTKDIELAMEADIVRIFPDYEVGAETPFGHLHGLKVYMDKSLQDNDYIFFNGGSHTDMIKMKMLDYIRLENPTVTTFAKLHT